MAVEFRIIITMIPKKERNVHATEKTISRQTGKLIMFMLVFF